MVLDVIAEEAISLLLGSVASLLQEKVDLALGAEDDLKQLESKLKYFQAAIKDADHRYSFLSDGRDIDLERTLRDVFYDAEDIIENYRTKIELVKREEDFASRNKVPNLWISLCSCFKKKFSFPYTLGKEIKDINERLEAIKRDYKEMLNLLKRSTPNVSGDHEDHPVINNPRETTHHLGPQPTIGREVDKENVEKLLLEGYSTESEVGVSIVSIVGQGGIGKTTLAKTVFNEVEEQFGDRRWWVCVSNKPNPMVLLQKILEVCKRSKKERDPDIERSEGQNKDITSLGLSELRTKLNKELSNGKFLLVLDDVWELDWWWGNVGATLTGGAMGSKILITSRRIEVSSGIGAKMHKLRVLTFDESWKLFLDKALKQEKELESHNLEDTAMKIVNKCGGLPLAVQTIGSLMRTKEMTKDDWEMIEKSEIWEWSMPASSSDQYGDILPALILSYDDLPNYYLRRCFVYCCIYPKDYEMKREELVMQWVAHGFIEEKNKHVAVEALANKYINDLISRCLIEETEAGDVKLHDILHDLASYIGGEEYSDASTTQHTRHLSLPNIENHANSGLGAANKLRTLFGKCNLNLSLSNIAQLAKFKRLRVLSLRNSEIKFELPDSIQDLLLLKYLDLSRSKVTHLPKSIGRLRNLQTLNLNGSAIEELPKEIGDLCSLKYLGLKNTKKLKFMAEGLGRLTNLRTLHRFLVRNNKGKTAGSNIRELKGLNKLKGSLSIEGLTGAMVIDAKEAHLKEKHELTDVKLYFKSSNRASINRGELLEALEPPRGIERLEIRDYEGGMPVWYSKANYGKLQELTLHECPSWGTVIGVNSLENVEVDMTALRSLEVYGCDNLEQVAHMPKLERLKVWGCQNLEQVAHMPTLEWLDVCACNKVEQVAHMPSLESLSLYGCDKLEQVADDMPALKTLRLQELNVVKQLPASLPSLEKLFIERLDEWEGWPTTMTSHSMSSLRSAVFGSCPKMETEGLISALSKVEGDDSQIQLQELGVEKCPRARLGWKLLMHLPNLIQLELDSTSAEVTSPFQPSEVSTFLPSLRNLYLYDYKGRDHVKWGRVPEWVWLLSRLEVSRLSRFSEEIGLGGRWQCLPKLTSLTLSHFRNLKSLVDVNGIIAQQNDGAAASSTATSVTIAKQQIDCLSKLETLQIYNCPVLHLPQELRDRLGKRFLTF